jgi:hypothetical protein
VFQPGRSVRLERQDEYGRPLTVHVVTASAQLVTLNTALPRAVGTLRLPPGFQLVSLQLTPCRWGGARPWWTCSGCRARCAVLLWWRDRWQCRACTGLHYASQYAPRSKADRRAGDALRGAEATDCTGSARNPPAEPQRAEDAGDAQCDSLACPDFRTR